MPHIVVDGQCGRHQRTVGAVCGHITKGLIVLEKQRDIADLLDEYIVLHGMRIVKMKFIVPMVRIRQEYRSQERYREDNKFDTVTHICLSIRGFIGLPWSSLLFL